MSVYATDAVTPSSNPEQTPIVESVQPPTATTPEESAATTPAEPVTPVTETSPPPLSTAVSETPAPAQSAATVTATGPQTPTGADSSKYTQNPDTGLWESDAYIWDPATGQTKPKQESTYSYNPATGMWDTTEWRYDAPSGTYQPHTVQVVQPPAGADYPEVPTSNQAFSLFYNAQISNGVNARSITGDALVAYNTTGGSALSGDALTMANIMNLLNSSTGFSNAGTIATFSSDIRGDVFGDLFIDPGALAALQPASSQSTLNDAKLQVQVSENNQIQNDINLYAKSGDATVTKNTTAGDATSGSAHAVANVINLLNSAISSGQSFVGALNIYGNLNGDILLPPEILKTMLANNASTGLPSSQYAQNTEVSADTTSTQTIKNNITTDAQTGTATVDKNTTAGSAQTGDALTNVNIINMTGRQVDASNSLLVFVNVLGSWVGVIMDAPTGSSSALLGTGVSKNTAMLSAVYDVATNNEVTNNIHVGAQSGDATVAANTNAGDAKTGDATASANVANIINSSFNLTDWFGVLFINVFGSWNGSFGVDTLAGERSPVANNPAQSNAAVRSDTVGVFRFEPTSSGGSHRSGLANTAAHQSDAGGDDSAGAGVRSASTEVNSTQPASNQAGGTDKLADITSQEADYWMPLFGFVFGGSLLGVERITSDRNRRGRAK